MITHGRAYRTHATHPATGIYSGGSVKCKYALIFRRTEKKRSRGEDLNLRLPRSSLNEWPRCNSCRDFDAAGHFRLLQIIRNKGSWPWGAHLRATPSETSQAAGRRTVDHPPRGNYRASATAASRGIPARQSKRRSTAGYDWSGAYSAAMRLWDRQIRCRAAGAGGCSPNPKARHARKPSTPARISDTISPDVADSARGGKPTFRFPTIWHRRHRFLRGGADGPRRGENGLPRQRARPSRLRLRPLALDGTGGLAFTQSRFCTFHRTRPTSVTRRRSLRFKTVDGRRGSRKRFSKATGASGSNISTAVSAPPACCSVRRRLRVRLGSPYRSDRPQSQARLAGKHHGFRRGRRVIVRAGLPPMELHAQTTYIHQGYPAFHALYTGRTASRRGRRRKRRGAIPPSSASACGRAASSTTTPSFPGFRPEQHRGRRRLSQRRSGRSRTLPIRITTPRGCSCARPSVFGGEQETVESAYGQMPESGTFRG